MIDNKEQGYMWIPYIIRVEKTIINGETVWYRNKWKNLLLKIKHVFIKPLYLENASKYANKKINSNYFSTFNITNKNKDEK